MINRYGDRCLAPLRRQVCVWLLFALVQNSACAQEDQVPISKDIVEIVDSQTGSLDIHGSVVSSEGQPLEDITVLYFFREFGDVLAQHEIDQKTKRVDAEFGIKKKGISSVNLTLLKEGYYSERWSFSFDENTPRTNPGGYERIDIEIVMTERPEPAALRRFEGALKTDLDGLVTVVEIKRQNGHETSLRRNGEQIDIKWPYLFLEAEVSAGGRFKKTTSLPKGRRMAIDVIDGGRIRPSQLDAEDGFIVYDPGDVPARSELAFRKMILAPDGEYKPELEIAAPDSPRWVYFFCKLNGQYGKGMVSGKPPVVVEGDRDVAVARIVVYLNPTGSRDVASVHD